jgi:hypothetical protein
VPAAPPGAASDPMNGKPQTGVVFHRSWTEGLLLSVAPNARSVLPPIVVLWANRMSRLSIPKAPSAPA